MRTLIIHFFILLVLFFPALTSASGGSCTYGTPKLICSDYNGTGWTITPSCSSYSPGHCATVGAIGKCASGGAYNVDSYYFSPSSASTQSSSCSGSGGIWTALSGSGSTTTISDARVFAFVAANYPSIFSGTPMVGQYQQYDYRYYPYTGNYLAVDTSGTIYVLGPITGGVITPEGSVVSWANTITAWEATQAGTSGGGSGSGGATTGSTSGGATGSATGQISIWTNSQQGVNAVYIDNVAVGGLTNFFTGTPTCGANGTITKTLSVGTHSVNATDTNASWGATNVTITAGGCLTYELTATSGGATGGSGSTGSTNGTTGGGTSGGAADYTASISSTETGETNFTLTSSNPNHLDTNEYIDVQTTTNIWAFTAAEYSVNIYLLDHANAQLFLNGSTFNGYPITSGGNTGMNFVTVAPGRYWIGTVPGQGSIGASYSNRVYHEVAYHSLANWVQDINVPLGTGAVNPGGWQSKGFSTGSGDFRAFIETEGMGGTFVVMTSSQFASFQAANPNRLGGGSYSYIYACGTSSGGAALEIECEMKLPANSSFYLVYMNDQQTVMGGAVLAPIEY